LFELDELLAAAINAIIRRDGQITGERQTSMDKDHLLIRLSASPNVSYGKIDFILQTFPQKVFSAIWAVEAEVNNGGFWQYFSNSSRETAHFVEEALQRIGAPKTADICRRAIAAGFPNGLPIEPEKIELAAHEFSQETLHAFGALDQEFYAYPQNLVDLLFAFVSDHPEEFGPIPKPTDIIN
jgi:hypothetical protein